MSEPNEPAKQPKAKTTVGEPAEQTATEARKDPVQSAIWAFFIGLALTILPIGRILGAVTSLILALLRPVLLVLGLVKLCEEIEERRK